MFKKKIRGGNGSPSPTVALSLLKSKDVSLVSYGHLTDEAKCLAEKFTALFSHVRKQGNSTIHNLTRHVSGFSVWMKGVPSNLNTIILAIIADIS